MMAQPREDILYPTYCVCSAGVRPLCLLTPQAELLGNEDRHSRGEELPNYFAIPAPGMQFKAIPYSLAEKKLLRSLLSYFNVLFSLGRVK